MEGFCSAEDKDEDMMIRPSLLQECVPDCGELWQAALTTS
jgi:hypothetical protein